jgi:hypothetical protein
LEVTSPGAVIVDWTTMGTSKNEVEELRGRFTESAVQGVGDRQ